MRSIILLLMTLTLGAGCGDSGETETEEKETDNTTDAGDGGDSDTPEENDTSDELLESLQRDFVDLRFGMFIHFGIRTFTGAAWATWRAAFTR